VLNSKWDLLIVDEIFSMHGYNFAHIFSEYNYYSIPYVVASTTNMMDCTAYANAIGKLFLFSRDFIFHLLFVGHNWVIHPSTYSPTPNQGQQSILT
jgi:hypothetical protein